MDQAFQAHLDSGLTTLARAWEITRKDGVTLGFTDHDQDLTFDGVVFHADSGMNATALQQGTGLSVDNTEALGVLGDARINARDIEAGRYDGAAVCAWIVNWADVSQRAVRFRGSIGELRRAGDAFHAELRGLTEALNRPLGRIYQKPCTAVLGDAACRVDLSTPGYVAEVPVQAVNGPDELGFDVLAGFEAGWFARGRAVVLSGEAAGLTAAIKKDVASAASRDITLWTALRAPIAPGDMVRLEAGCDKRFDTCRFKFNNVLNFQGFPDLPSEDWLAAVPAKSGDLSGGSRR